VESRTANGLIVSSSWAFPYSQVPLLALRKCLLFHSLLSIPSLFFNYDRCVLCLPFHALKLVKSGVVVLTISGILTVRTIATFLFPVLVQDAPCMVHRFSGYLMSYPTSQNRKHFHKPHPPQIYHTSNHNGRLTVTTALRAVSDTQTSSCVF
jgi:hypothetical protein